LEFSDDDESDRDERNTETGSNRSVVSADAISSGQGSVMDITKMDSFMPFKPMEATTFSQMAAAATASSAELPPAPPPIGLEDSPFGGGGGGGDFAFGGFGGSGGNPLYQSDDEDV